MKKSKKVSNHNNKINQQNSFFENNKVAFSVWLIPLAIAIITFIVFLPSLNCDFLGYDDEKYIIQELNNKIKKGK